MKRFYSSIFLASALMMCGGFAKGQVVGDNVFLQGAYLEVAVAPIGCWGNTVAPPAGYHGVSGGSTFDYTDPGTGTAYSGTSTMDFQYNPGHGGWTVAGTGGVPEYGPYYLPGTPFVGWSVQANGVREDAFYNNGGPTGSITETSMGFTHVAGMTYGSCYVQPGVSTSIWQGTAASGALSITEYNRVDTLSSWDVVTVLFKNTSTSTLTGLYYMASADPDNDEVTTGGSFPTNNHVMFQNDYRHRVMVEARPPTIHQDAYSSLCTRDCRAESFIYESWPPFLGAGNTLDLIYAGTATGIGTGYYTVGSTTLDQDIAYGLIYSLGDLPAGDSTIISFAWNFKDSTTVDSAFPDPVVMLNCVVTDSFLVCEHPGVTIVNADIKNATDKDWSWSTWTWSPSIGLSATTGTDITINTSVLTGPTTYTVTGTDSATGMHSCNTYVLYVTIVPCFGATNNSAICYGQILHLDAIGDSVGATYQWYNPAGTPISTLHHVVIPGATYADSGTYMVVRTVGTEQDTATTHVVIRWKPTIAIFTNEPLCTGAIDTLHVTTAPDSAGETFVWSGPGGFADTAASFSINGFNAADTGIYTVIATTSFGCLDTATFDGTLAPQPPPPGVTGKSPYCYDDIPQGFTLTGMPGATYKWYTTPTGGTFMDSSYVNTMIVGDSTYYVSQVVAGCESLRDSVKVTILPPIVTDFTTAIHRGCSFDTVFLTNLSANYNSQTWSFGDGTTAGDSVGMHTYPSSYPYSNPNCFAGTITLTVGNGYCDSSFSVNINTSHYIHAQYSIAPDTICLGGSTNLIDASVGGGLTYLWEFGDGSNSTTTGTVSHTYNIPGRINSKLIITDSISCQDSATEPVYVLDFTITSFHDTTLCLGRPLAIPNTETSNMGSFDYTYSWAPSTGLDDPTAQVPYFYAFGDFQYILTATLQPYGCLAYDTVNIQSVLGAKLTNVTDSQVIMLGSTVQLNADDEVIYYWLPDDGTLSNPNINNPVATPSVTTVYTVYGRDIYGCLDSSYVKIIVDTAVTQIFPSGFTPNGDGLNDVFRPIGITYQNLVEFRVFNRWGQQVFYSNDKARGWDGTFNGVPQDMDTYYWVAVIQYPGQMETMTYKGQVTLIR
jgi:gliding motility-associated-like protein